MGKQYKQIWRKNRLQKILFSRYDSKKYGTYNKIRLGGNYGTIIKRNFRGNKGI